MNSTNQFVNCSFLFDASNTTYIFVPSLGDGFCCVCFEGVGATPPDFVFSNSVWKRELGFYEPLTVAADMFYFTDDENESHIFYSDALTSLPLGLEPYPLSGGADQWLVLLPNPPPAWAWNLGSTSVCKP